MRVLVVYAHPLATSYHAALHTAAVNALSSAGHQVDDLDLNAEGFDPVLGQQERAEYHDLSRNRTGVEPYMTRIENAEALVFCFPVWSFGPPAILKGFFDRLLKPGFAFELDEAGTVRPNLGHIRKIAGITTYGRSRIRALYMGDPPRKMITRYVRYFAGRSTTVVYLAHYDMNVSTPETRGRFLAKVRTEMERF